MFGFGGGDDFVEDMIILDMLECGNCRGRCTCGYGRQNQRQQRLGCGRCYGSCGCSGYDSFGNLLETAVEVAIVEEIIEDFGGW